MRRCSSRFIPSLAAAGALAAADAQAHGFGQRFDLPLPLWLWVTGAAATLVLTFAALALFAREREFAGVGRSVDLLRWRGARRVAGWLAGALRAAACALFLLALAAGWFGDPDAYANPIVALVWVAWWVGMAFICALVGDLWEVVDPLRTLYLGAARVVSRIAGTRRESLGLRYPERLGAWPAVALFFAFAWVELLWADKDVPRHLASAVFAYALLTWCGMFLFGVETWRNHGDAFALAFRVLGRFAPLELRSATRDAPARLRLRPYAAGLLDGGRVPASVVVFVLLMLSTVTFDGFHETPAMERIETAAQGWRPMAETLFALSELGLPERQVLHSVGMLLFPLGFVLLFAVVARLMLRLARADAGMNVNAMVWTLVPIAVAYHLSHYFTLLFTTGQFIVPLASDPFGRGWDLFGTRGHKVDLTIVSPTVYWYGSVVLIVVGHVLSVVVAHVEARRRFASHRAALRSQVPMVALMVAYTSLSLWIMAQPIVG